MALDPTDITPTSPIVVTVDEKPISPKLCPTCPARKNPLVSLFNRMLNPETPLGHKFQGAFLALVLIILAEKTGVASPDQIKFALKAVLASYLGTQP